MQRRSEATGNDSISTRRRWHAPLVFALGAALAIGAPVAASAAKPSPAPGAPGAGDPYFPLAGNGGYDVKEYDLDVGYDPATDTLTGSAVIKASATQALSSFNLDLDGLDVGSVTVNGRAAVWTRSDGELTITPKTTLNSGAGFTTTVEYSGVPEPVDDVLGGVSGFLHTDDGSLVAGQPFVASTWFPVNDHPIDKARYAVTLTVPKGLEAVSNGRLVSMRDSGDSSIWVWRTDEPMASYLATATIGEFDIDAYTADGIRYWDAIDPDLMAPTVLPHTGAAFAYSDRADDSYKRLQRTLAVPADDSELSFWVDRDTEQGWDFAFVELAPSGTDDWTTLPDVGGNTTQETGQSCPAGWNELHPQLDFYQTIIDDTSCDPTGTSGEWNAASGNSGGWQQWSVDLSAYAGSSVEVSIAYISDWSTQGLGVFVDDIEVSTGEGTTSFENGDTGGWEITGPPPGSAPNPNNFIITTGAGFPEAAVVATPHSLLSGFGFEGITDAAIRAEWMGRVLDHLLD